MIAIAIVFPNRLSPAYWENARLMWLTIPTFIMKDPIVKA
jgi:hypothetical protein